MDSGDIVEVWDGKSKGPPRKEKFPDKDMIVEIATNECLFEL